MVSGVHSPISMKALADEFRWFCGAAQTPILRTMRQFAEQELVLPDGPFEGEKFRPDVQPYARLWLDEIGCPHPSQKRRKPDDGTLASTMQMMWNTFVTTGPSQTGKTLLCSVLPVMYHLFEIGETVIFAVPDMNMAQNKWEVDFLPAIRASRYRDLLPTKGEGSQGGKIKDMVTFQNGARLKFMSGGGGDKSRSAFTSRVLVVTEVDGFATSGSTSHEANKLEQLFARTNAYEDDAVHYLECTVTVKNAPIWSMYQSGTASRIICPCPHCKAWVSPERDDLQGWKGASSEKEAEDNTAFFCNACGEAFSDDQRVVANRQAKLLHRGQSIQINSDTGVCEVVGEPAPTRTFGFRWSGFNNLFWRSARYGREEFNGSRATDEDNAERKLRQFIWSIPYDPPTEQLSQLEANALTNRIGAWPRGLVPPDTLQLIFTIDVQKRELYWTCIAFRPFFAAHVVDYGVANVPSDHLGIEKAIYNSLSNLADEICDKGFPIASFDNPREPSPVFREIDLVGVDLGYKREAVVAFLHSKYAKKETASRYTGMQGYGTGQQAGTNYSLPKSTGATVMLIGENYHIASSKDENLAWFESDSDEWKSFLHARLSEPLPAINEQCAEPSSALTLFNTTPREHIPIAKQWTAEEQVREYVAGKGEKTKWIRKNKNNHYLDTSYMACVLAHYMGVRLQKKSTPVPDRQNTEDQTTGITMPDGRPYLVLDRLRQ